MLFVFEIKKEDENQFVFKQVKEYEKREWTIQTEDYERERDETDILQSLGYLDNDTNLFQVQIVNKSKDGES